jgi:hypothetical protein
MANLGYDSGQREGVASGWSPGALLRCDLQAPLFALVSDSRKGSVRVRNFGLSVYLREQYPGYSLPCSTKYHDGEKYRGEFAGVDKFYHPDPEDFFCVEHKQCSA